MSFFSLLGGGEIKSADDTFADLSVPLLALERHQGYTRILGYGRGSIFALEIGVRGEKGGKQNLGAVARPVLAVEPRRPERARAG